jgi:hypothetical protein
LLWDKKNLVLATFDASSSGPFADFPRLERLGPIDLRRHGLLIFYVQVNDAPSPKGVRNAYAQIWTEAQATFYRGYSTRYLETDGTG